MERNKKMDKKKETITRINGTDDNKEILNLLKDKFKTNDRGMQQENNGLIS